MSQGTPSRADLTGCREKLARAKEKLDSLKFDTTNYIAGRPYEVTNEIAGDTSRLRFTLKQPLRRSWGVDAGEIATGVRSALDYLVYQLAIDSGANPRTGRTQFPIFLSEEDYRKGGRKSHRERMLAGVAQRHRRQIDKLQPFHRGVQAAVNDPLTVLRAVSDHEKHKDLHVTVAVMQTLTLRMAHPGGTAYYRMHFAEAEPLNDGQVIFEMPLSEVPPPPPGTEFGIEGTGRTPDFDIGYVGDRLVTAEGLDRIVLHVSGIVDFFERRIST